MHTSSIHTRRGFTLVELLVTAAIAALVFGGLLGSIQFALKLIANSKLSTSALALANEKIEYIRSLSYADVGTVGGIPDGLIPQNATTSLNGVEYFERVLIQYVDSPDDGIGGADTNGILADYKEVKVEYSWIGTNGTSSIFLLTNVVPPGIESTAGGGTLTVNVFDANVLPVSGASVRIYNNTTTTTIDTTRFTNSDGIAMFAGAPAAANYEITVTKAGYSTDQTYTATTSNPSPLTSPVAVVESAVSTMNFQIDRLSDLLVRTVGPSTDGLFSDTFDTTNLIASSTAIDVVAGSAVLTGGAGSYASQGMLIATSTTPSPVTAWSTIQWNAVVPVNTTFTLHVYAVTGVDTYTLIPDTDLPGNSVGFTSGPINISSLSPATYPSLALTATLTSSDVAATPALTSWQIGYVITEPSIGNIPFTLTSTKIIGSTPVYKYVANHTTNGSGQVQLEDLEWDLYNLTLGTGAYNIQEACPSLPYTLNPGVSDTLTITLVPSENRSLRVTVVDVQGDPIVGAQVTLTLGGSSNVGTTSSCGQTFFNAGLSESPAYSVDVTASGYTSQTLTDINIDGAETLQVTLAAS